MGRTPQADSWSSRVVCQRIARAAVATPELPAYNIFIRSMPPRSAWKTRAISVRYDGVRVTSLPTARTNLINAAVAKQPAPVIKSIVAPLAKSLQGVLQNLAFFTVLFVTVCIWEETRNSVGMPGMRSGKEGSSACADSTHCRSRTEHDYWLIFLHRLSNLYSLLLLLRQYRRCVIQPLSKVDKNSSRKKRPLINQKWLRLCLCIRPRCLNFTKPSTLSSMFPVIKST